MARTLSSERAVALVDLVEALPDVAEGWSDPWHTRRLNDQQVKDEISDAVDAVRAATGRDRIPGSGESIAEAICDFAYDGNASGIPGVYGAIRDRVGRDGLKEFDDDMGLRGIEVAGGTPVVLWYGRPADDVSHLTFRSIRDSLMLAADMKDNGAGDARMAAGATETIPDQLAELDGKYLRPFGATSLEDATDGELEALSRGGYAHVPRGRDGYARMCRDDPGRLAIEIDNMAADLLPLDKLARYDYAISESDATSGTEPNPWLADIFKDAVNRAQETIDGADSMARSGLVRDYANGYGIVCAYDDDPEKMIDATLAERDRALAYVQAISQDANQPATGQMLSEMSATSGLADLSRPEPKHERAFADFDDEAGYTAEPEEDFDWHDDDDGQSGPDAI